MAIPASPVSTPLYRPKKLPRVIRRQLPVFGICGVIVLVGAVALAVTWRNLTHERLVIEVGLQQSRMESLKKEVEHLKGQVEIETSYTRISKWARQEHGWTRTAVERERIVVPDSLLTRTARAEAEALGVASHE